MMDIVQARILTDKLNDRQIGYQDWADGILGKDYRNYYSDEYLRRASKVLSIFLDRIADTTDNKTLKETIDDLKAERIKIQTANLEYNAIQRAEARNDLFYERIIDAIERLEPIHIKEPKKPTNKDIQKQTALLVVSDLHAGSTFVVYGLNNEIINEYSYDIMVERMWSIIEKIEADAIDFDDMIIAICGDVVEGILRESSLAKLREPVIDTVVRLGDFLSNWIARLSEYLGVSVNVVIVPGNHDCTRMLTSKPAFEGESLTKIVIELIKLRLRDFSWIKVDDFREVAVKNIQGVNVMFQHGEDKDLKTTIDYFSNLYHVEVDEIICGHKHLPETKTIGIADVGDRTVTRVGSIVGVDTFAKKIRSSARPSCYMAIYNATQGKTWSRNYYL